MKSNYADEPLALTIKKTSNSLSISDSTVWKLIRTGKLRVIRIGGRTLIPRAEVERLLAGAVASVSAN